TTIVDKTGAELGSYMYNAYGNVLSETGTIAKENPIRYASYYYDQETKHYYLKARYYDPQNGNFLALDPHPGDDDDPVSQNGYTYAGNNPLSFVDPTGLFSIKRANYALKYAYKYWLSAYIGWSAAGAVMDKVWGILAAGIVGVIAGKVSYANSMGEISGIIGRTKVKAMLKEARRLAIKVGIRAA
uniref:RHS repeat-associated core domain-containing protein n=1 Tax=Bacillus rubiinfantis TaxID=1499680 RepID=UPI0011DC7857